MVLITPSIFTEKEAKLVMEGVVPNVAPVTVVSEAVPGDTPLIIDRSLELTVKPSVDPLAPVIINL